MPGKRKKDRKDNRTGKNKAKSNDASNRGGQPRVTSKVQPKDRKDAPRVFTLKDEAAKSTYRSSKRLWQGEGQKLRNLPVEFVRALEKYDPGQYLREQIEANARKHAEATEESASRDEVSLTKQEPTRLVDSTDDSSIVNAELTDIKNVKQTHDAFGGQELESVEKSLNLIATDNLIPAASEAEIAGQGTVMENLDHDVLDLDHTKHVAATSNGSLSRDMTVIESEFMPSTSSNIDMVLKNMLEHEDLEMETPEEHSEDQDMSLESEDPQSIAETTIPLQETPSSTDAELFVVDVKGEAASTDHDPSDNEEILLFRPRQPKESRVEIRTTLWARTINDPVVIDELDPNTYTPPAFVHAFEDKASSKRGKRGGRKKYEKQQAFAKSARRDDIDIMFDYMDNANWTDESESEEDNEGAEPLINQLLSEMSAADHLQTELTVGGTENEESSSSDSGDDSDIDDDLELMIEAEMEEMEFDLGYTGGRSRKGVRYGADRELVDHALYHEDFNVFQYNSSADELSASGARKRGLNKFMDDLDLSNEELEASLIAQWKKDRGSKKAKKRDRQRLHKDGLIGKKAKRARMSHEVDTHSSGELDGFHLHIKKFVTHTDYAGIEELPMPAMDKAIRRAVHLLSQAYGLKSASQGSGKRRHITLYKTKHTAQLPDADYLEETLFRARRSLGFNSKYRDTLLPEAAQKKLGRSGKPMRTGRSGGNGPGSRLRDGDLVGADAPEIAIANRGRQMLQKLGWLHGSGLGAVGKEGINLPLFATIKNSKHGLQ